MEEKIAPSRRNSYAPRDIDPRTPYDAAVLLAFALGQPWFHGRLESIGDDGANPRRQAGLAWREYAIDEVTGDLAAISRWQGEQRRLIRELPGSIGGVIPVLSRDLGAPIVVTAGRTLDLVSARRLQAITVRSMNPRALISDADRKFRRRALAHLDPPGGALVLLESATTSLLPGALVAISATAAASGSWHVEPVRPGYPAIGMVATQIGAQVGIVPRPFPGASSEREFTFLMNPS